MRQTVAMKDTVDIPLCKDPVAWIVGRVNVAHVWRRLPFQSFIRFLTTMGTAQSMLYTTEPDPPPKQDPGLITNVANIRYLSPWKRDMAIGLVFFNPARSKRMLMNYLYTVEKLKLAKIPYYTLELVFHKQEPEIRDAFHVWGMSHMFHKERLCTLLEAKIPWYYSKVLFMDADILFGNNSWYSDVSSALSTHDVVQPFTTAVWMDITYTKAMQKRESVVYMDKTKTYDHKLHPGFAWAFRRQWFRKVGFFQYGITGSGDTLSTAAWLSVKFPATYLKPALVPAYNEFNQLPKPRMTCIAGSVYHLWHGTHQNRKYVDRHAMLDGIADVRKIMRPNWSGVWEFSVRGMSEKLLTYFLQREDDSI